MGERDGGSHAPRTTPPPPSMRSLAALTMASPVNRVMSPGDQRNTGVDVQSAAGTTATDRQAAPPQTADKRNAHRASQTPVHMVGDGVGKGCQQICQALGCRGSSHTAVRKPKERLGPQPLVDVVGFCTISFPRRGPPRFTAQPRTPTPFPLQLDQGRVFLWQETFAFDPRCERGLFQSPIFPGHLQPAACCHSGNSPAPPPLTSLPHTPISTHPQGATTAS